MRGERPPHIVVMGVTGCGKTTIARQAAGLAAAEFLDADDLHPLSNIEKMAAGIALTDADRVPWLAAVRDWIRSRERQCVVACSALRRRYRDVLREVPDSVAFVHLDGESDAIWSRMTARSGHFMPTALLASQLALLEPLEPDEFGIAVDLGAKPDEIARSVVAFAQAARKVAR